MSKRGISRAKFYAVKAGLKAGNSRAEVAKKHGLKESTVREIKRLKTWTAWCDYKAKKSAAQSARNRKSRVEKQLEKDLKEANEANNNLDWWPPEPPVKRPLWKRLLRIK